jgi:sigma-54 dependent transcriptional regulator, acetoin dehydrogenase operon transcriptional activator AcoR
MDRVTAIAVARQQFLHDGRASEVISPYVRRSWERCVAAGRVPQQRVAFDLVSAAAIRRTTEEHHTLIDASRPVLRGLQHTMQSTGYFAILTDRNGVVIATDGPIDMTDRRYSAITRIGVDLSESSVGTTAIGAALAELQPVRLHRAEHFFDDNSIYSCAGAPLFDAEANCVGMLDLTGVMVNERPELKHLVARATRAINDALVRKQAHALLLHLTWPHIESAQSDEGLVAIDTDGRIVGANVAARKMIGELAKPGRACHVSEVFATRWTDLFAKSYEAAWREVPTWSGLIMQVRAHSQHSAVAASSLKPQPTSASLRDVELEMIRRAVTEARGNVDAAARALGISRATVYRKLHKKS